jgi:hypothetical protein
MPCLVFSYGSNSTAQLRARVGNLQLQSRPAHLPNFARVFCLRSRGWGGGGVASIAPAEGRTVYGAVVELSDDEKLALDGYEGGYRSHGLDPAGWTTVSVVEADGQVREAVAYVAGSGAGSYTQPMAAPPTEQYLTAIHCMLREHWSMDGETIDILVHDGSTGALLLLLPPPLLLLCISGTSELLCSITGTVWLRLSVTVGEPTLRWNHPGAAALSLEALCVEVSTRRSVPWEMPKTIHEVVDKLKAIGMNIQM